MLAVAQRQNYGTPRRARPLIPPGPLGAKLFILGARGKFEEILALQGDK